MRGTLSTLATVWRIASPYFRSEDRWPGRILLIAVIAIELSIVGISVLLNEWNARFYNALQERDWNAFVYQLGYFSVLAAAFILLAVYQLYLNQWLQIRWRRWLTQVYLRDWLTDSTHYRMQLQGDAADNPDQRIADDLSQFIQLTLTIGLQVLNSTVTLVSFSIILWGLSSNAPLPLQFLPFLGSAIVPTASMPAAMRVFAENQPFTPIIETLRGLLMGTAIGHSGLLAVAWCVGLGLVGYLWSRRAFNRPRTRLA